MCYLCCSQRIVLHSSIVSCIAASAFHVLTYLLGPSPHGRIERESGSASSHSLFLHKSNSGTESLGEVARPEQHRVVLGLCQPVNARDGLGWVEEIGTKDNSDTAYSSLTDCKTVIAVRGKVSTVV